MESPIDAELPTHKLRPTFTRLLRYTLLSLSLLLPALLYLLISIPSHLPLPPPLHTAARFLRTTYRRLVRADQFTVLLLNDIHYDSAYLPTGTPENRCRTAVSKPNASYAFGQYGCDTSKLLFSSLLNYAAKVVPSPDFIFIAGDFAPHGVSAKHRELLAIFETVFAMIGSVYPSVPIYAAMGNHDFDPPWGSVATDPDDFVNFGKAQVYLSDSELETFHRGGYFFHDFGAVRLLFLNSVMYSTSRKNTGDRDPFGQFAWIEKTAEDARAAGLVVGTIMHIPAGVQKVSAKESWYPEYHERYQQLTLKWDIQFALNGHSHLDQFLPTEMSDSPRYSLSGPAVSPVDGNNPGFRVLKIDEKGLENYQQYGVNILGNPKSSLDWQMEYEFKEAYGVNDLSPDGVAKAALFARDDMKGKWEYHARIYNQAIPSGGFYYCALTCSTAEELLNCQKQLAQDVKFS